MLFHRNPRLPKVYSFCSDFRQPFLSHNFAETRRDESSNTSVTSVDPMDSHGQFSVSDTMDYEDFGDQLRELDSDGDEDDNDELTIGSQLPPIKVMLILRMLQYFRYSKRGPTCN